MPLSSLNSIHYSYIISLFLLNTVLVCSVFSWLFTASNSSHICWTGNNLTVLKILARPILWSEYYFSRTVKFLGWQKLFSS